MEEDSDIDKLKEFFDFCDIDKSGYLSVQELQDSAGQYLSEEDLGQLMGILDPHGHGEISFPEFCKGVETVLQTREDRVGECSESQQYEPLTVVGATNPLLVMSHDIPDHGSSVNDGIFLPVDSSSKPWCRENSGSDLINLNDESEQYESYGEGNHTDEDGNHHENYLQPVAHLSPDYLQNGNNRNSTPFQQRNTWIRNSLRRSNRSSKRLSSSALAHQLYRSSSPLNGNSPRSGDYDSDGTSSDQVSIEDDVQALNDRIHQLQEQVTMLKEGQCNSDNKYDKVKQENMSLMTRIHSLEEQLREHEIKSEERISEEQQRLKEMMIRNEREKNLELEEHLNRVHTLQQESLATIEEISRLKIQIEKLKQENLQLQEQLEANLSELSLIKEEKQRMEDLAFQEKEDFMQNRSSNNKLLEQLNRELQELRQYQQETECVQRFRSPSMQELPSRFFDLEKELRAIREENNGLREANEELQAQLLNTSLEKGCILLAQNTTTTLGEELESLSKEQLMKALRDQEEDNAKLRTYIDGMLLNIVENYPELLEVRPTM